MFVETYTSPAALCAAVETTRPPIPEWSSGHIPLKPYEPTPEVTAICDELRRKHGQRQLIIKAQTKAILQARSIVSVIHRRDGDWDDDAAKKAARKRIDGIFAEARANEDHPEHVPVVAVLSMADAVEPLRKSLESGMVKLAKQLPVYPWVKSVKGFGDTSFATIVGEAGDIGTYRSVSALWKRMGVAVIGGARQGDNNHAHITDDMFPPDVLEAVLSKRMHRDAAEWVVHGYRKSRRAVSWNARKLVIGSMGLWRPDFGSDLSDATYYQRVYAERARYEAARSCYHKHKDGSPKLDANGEIIRIACSDKGKESYSGHAANRAHRYVEKRLLKHLYLEWRRA